MLGNKVYEFLSQFTDRIYGNPGTTELSFLKGKPESFKYFLALHDGIAVGMAEGYYLKESKLGIVNLHASPGLSNAMGFINTAFLDRSPLLIIAGQQSSKFLNDEPRLYGDLTNMAKPFTKGSFEAKSEDEVIRLLMRASKLALTPPYGPVMVSIPEDLQLKESTRNERRKVKHDVSLCCNEESVKEVVERVNSHERVALVVGYEIDVFNAHDELNDFVIKGGLPVYAEPFSSRAPYSGDSKFFMGDLPRRSSEINNVLKEYSMVLVIGGSLGNVLFPDDEILKGKEVVQITQDWMEASKRPWDTFVCNPKQFLKLASIHISQHKFVGKKVERKPSPVDKIFQELSGVSQRYAVFDEAPSYREALRASLGYRRNSLFSNRAGFIGWAIPAAFGYASAGGSALVVIGDGSFNYSFQALWSAQKYGGRMKVLVINNSGYNSLRGWSGLKDDILSPETSPWKLASSYGFEAKEFDDYKRGLEWLLSDDAQKLVELRIN